MWIKLGHHICSFCHFFSLDFIMSLFVMWLCLSITVCLLGLSYFWCVATVEDDPFHFGIDMFLIFNIFACFQMLLHRFEMHFENVADIFVDRATLFPNTTFLQTTIDCVSEVWFWLLSSASLESPSCSVRLTCHSLCHTLVNACIMSVPGGFTPTWTATSKKTYCSSTSIFRQL